MIRVLLTTFAGAAMILGLVVAVGCATNEPVPHSRFSPSQSDARVRDDDHVHDHDQLVAHAHDHDHEHAHADDHGEAHARAHAAEGGELTHADLHPAHDPDAPCTCLAMRRIDGWCRSCNVGYVAGNRVEWAILFETLDPHGHQLDLDSLSCDRCRAAIESDEFCGSCGMGFVGGMAYFTPLTHGLARGERVEPTGLSCARCRVHAGGIGWCRDCSRGMVGRVAFADRDVFDQTAREYAVFHRAIERATACELCACAMVVHGTCPKCLISYQSEEER